MYVYALSRNSNRYRKKLHEKAISVLYNMYSGMWWKGLNAISNRVSAYIRTCKLLYDQCLEERMQFESEHRHDGQKHKYDRKHASQRAKLIYEREKTATATGQVSTQETSQ
jgi:hypothetical protein